MSLKTFIQGVVGVRHRSDDTEGLVVNQRGSVPAEVEASRVDGILMRGSAGQKEAVVQRGPARRLLREDDELAQNESSSEILPEGQIEVAASELTVAASDAAPDAGAASGQREAAAKTPATSPFEEDSGWLPEGFWPTLGGVALIGGVSLATDDDEDDSNDAPVISSNGGGANAALNVAENVTVVTTVAAADPDAGDTVSYTISGGADAALFSINVATGVLRFIAARNFEAPQDSGTNNVYDVVVTASDGSRSDTQTIAVTITNTNEAPSISSNGGAATAAVNVAENGTAVTTVAAADPDAGATVSYSITGGADMALFSIDSGTGALSFLSAPDFEVPLDAGADNAYVLIVTASDGSLTDTQTITVTVTDVSEPAAASDEISASALDLPADSLMFMSEPMP